MTSRSRILANLNSADVKSSTHPPHKITVQKTSSKVTASANTSQRKTFKTFQPENIKPTNLFSTLPQKPTQKKSVRRGKENQLTKLKDGGKDRSNKTDNTLKVYQDAVAHSSNLKQSDSDLICDEFPSERYWELLAEERRKALKIALDENQELANNIKAKEETIKCLHEEVTELKETVKHTEKIMAVMENLLQADYAHDDDTRLQSEETTSDGCIDESYANARDNKSDEDKNKFEGYAEGPLQPPLCLAVEKATDEADVNSSN